MTTEVRRTVASAVMGELRRAERTPSWLADRIRLSPEALADRLAGRVDFTVTDLAGIAVALGIPASRLLPVLDG